MSVERGRINRNSLLDPYKKILRFNLENDLISIEEYEKSLERMDIFVTNLINEVNR